MTALIMPSDYGMEMLVGSSPVLGSSFLGSPYFGCPSPWSHTRTPTSCSAESVITVTAKGCTAASTTFGFNVPITVARMAPSSDNGGGFTRVGSTRRSLRGDAARRRKVASVIAPRLQNLKSCLVSKTDELQLEGAISPTKEKKRVSFADMLGLTLAQIKVITERPDCPPRWSSDFLEQVTGGAKPQALPDQWKLTFRQPASDYLSFKSRLEADSVALENVILRDSESLITGTIKVRNISFHKKVTVRYTVDNWHDHEDVEATYVTVPSSSSSYNIYDTFSFSFALPSSGSSDKLEFCICYEADWHVFWDNNCNKNYAIVAFVSKPPANKRDFEPKEVREVSLDSWSEFSAWNNLSQNGSPYW